MTSPAKSILENLKKIRNGNLGEAGSVAKRHCDLILGYCGKIRQPYPKKVEELGYIKLIFSNKQYIVCDGQDLIVKNSKGKELKYFPDGDRNYEEAVNFILKI